MNAPRMNYATNPSPEIVRFMDGREDKRKAKMMQKARKEIRRQWVGEEAPYRIVQNLEIACRFRNLFALLDKFIEHVLLHDDACY